MTGLTVGKFNAVFGYTEDQNCGLRSSKLLSSWSVIMDQSAVGRTDSWTVCSRLRTEMFLRISAAVIILLLLDCVKHKYRY